MLKSLVKHKKPCFRICMRVGNSLFKQQLIRQTISFQLAWGVLLVACDLYFRLAQVLEHFLDSNIEIINTSKSYIYNLKHPILVFNFGALALPGIKVPKCFACATRVVSMHIFS